jgi:hypothetical protein
LSARAFFIAAGFLALSTPAQGQEISLRDFGAGVSVGHTSNPATFFSPALCPDSNPRSYRVHGLIWLKERFFVSLGFSHNTEEPDLCFVAFCGLYPPLPLGSFTSRSKAVDPAIRGYPFQATDLQVGARVGTPTAGLRAGVGPVWFHGKPLTGTVVAAAATVRLLRLPVALALGMDHTFLRVPYTEVEAQFEDGRMVRTHLTPTNSREVTRVLRLGLETSW